MSGYNLELMRGRPIPFESVFLHFPTLSEICDTNKYGGMDSYNAMMLPFCIDFNFVGVPERDQIGRSFFECIIMKHPEYLQIASWALMLFTEAEKIQYTPVTIQLDEFVVSKDNWNELAECIRVCNGLSILKPPEEAPENARQRDIFEKLNRGRAKYEEKNGIRLEDELNFLEHGPGRMYSVQELDGMTIWQIKNAFNAKLQVLEYQQCFQAALVSGKTKGITDKNFVTSRLRLKS